MDLSSVSTGCYEPRYAARRTDPTTSHKAAGKATFFVGSHRFRVLSALIAHGPCTPHELEKYTGLTVVQMDRRLPELAAAGMAKVSTHPSGAEIVRGTARVWEAIED